MTLSTSDINNLNSDELRLLNKRITKLTKLEIKYLLLTLFCVLFGAVYEYFSHGVYSCFMLYAFVFPLVLGVLPLVIISHSKTKKLPGAFSGQLYGCGIFTLTLGSMVKGALDIYGTTSHLSKYYFPVGLVLLLIGAISYLVTIGHHKKSA